MVEDRQSSLKIFQKGFNYSQDGRGNRLVLHLQGCNMRCPWCSNPEGIPAEGVLFTEAEWLEESCCPKGAVRDRHLDRSVCAQCEDRPCLRRRQKGIRLSCRQYSLEEVAEECVRSKPMFFDGGGVTLTGGEISMQFEAVKKLLIRLKAEDIHCAIECNGSHSRMMELAGCVDQWIMDVKHYDEEKHRKWIGVSNGQTIRNLEEITAVHQDVLVRIPLIPGFNDTKEDAEGFARLLSRSVRGSSTRVEFLIYHEFGRGKWEQCGEKYRMMLGRIRPGTAEYFEKVLMSYGITCIRT